MTTARPVIALTLALSALLLVPTRGASLDAGSASVAAIPSELPSQIRVTLPNGEGIALLGNSALALYRDGPLTEESCRGRPALPDLRTTLFVVDEATRVRLARLILHEVRSAPPRSAPRLSGPRPLEVSCYYSRSQTGGKSKLELASRDLERSSTINARALVALVRKIIQAHRHDDEL